jgi:hypothetical protein
MAVLTTSSIIVLIESSSHIRAKLSWLTAIFFPK